MQILSAELRDILSIKEGRVEFTNQGMTLYNGWNYDDGTANGAGKSAVLNGICFGLYDKTPRNIKKTEIVRRGSKTAMAHITVKSRDDIWEVIRFRPNKVVYIKNGQELDISQNEFEDAIGLNYDQFLLLMYNSQLTPERLINVNDTGKKNFFMQMLNFDKIMDVKKNSDNVLKSIKSDITDVEKDLVRLNTKNEMLQDSLVDENDLRNKADSIDIEKIDKALDTLSTVSKPDFSKYNDIETKMAAKTSELRDKEFIIRDLNRQIQAESKVLDKKLHIPDSVDCPHCKEGFVIGNNGSVTIESIKKDFSIEQEKAKERMGTLELELSGMPDIAAEKDKITNLKKQLDNKKKEDFESYEVAQEKIRKISAEKYRLESLKKQYEDKIAANSVIRKQISKIEEAISDSTESLTGLSNDKQIYETISHIFSPQGAPAYVLDSVLEIFNDKIQNYIGMIWPRASYTLIAYKETKAGDVRAKFSENLVINGEQCSIGSLSGGEEKCLSIAADLAIIDVMQDMMGTKISPIIMDESFNSLDAVNKEKVIELLEMASVDREIVVIDHSSETHSMFSRVVNITKRSGVSSIS